MAYESNSDFDYSLELLDEAISSYLKVKEYYSKGTVPDGELKIIDTREEMKDFLSYFKRKIKTMAKGLDGKFLHYGIRKEDLDLIRTLCEKHEIDFDWMSEEILRKYHAAKVDKIEMNDEDTEKIIAEAISQIK